MRRTILVLLILWTAMQVVLIRHDTRRLFVELQELEQERDELIDEWGRLQIEQATWGTHGRIEEIARKQLDMALPQASQIIITER